MATGFKGQCACFDRCAGLTLDEFGLPGPIPGRSMQVGAEACIERINQSPVS